MLDALLPRTDIPPWDALSWPPRVHPAIFVHRVEGLEPGLYILPRSRTALDGLRQTLRPEFLWEKAPGAPEHLPLYLPLPADLKDFARMVSCHQDIASASAFSLGVLAEFDRSLAEGPWWYRRLHWESGMLGHVQYLEAEAAGLRATGIGCFFDDEMHRLLGLGDETFQTLHHFTVGNAVEDLRLLTLPPYAHLDRIRRRSAALAKNAPRR